MPLPYREPKCAPPELEGFEGGEAAAASGDWMVGWEVTASGTRNWTCSDGEPQFFGTTCDIDEGGALQPLGLLLLPTAGACAAPATCLCVSPGSARGEPASQGPLERLPSPHPAPLSAHPTPPPGGCRELLLHAAVGDHGCGRCGALRN